MTTSQTMIPTAFRADVETLWEFHDMHHEVRPCDVIVGLGSHDLAVATHCAELFQAGYAPRIGRGK
ncbi:hypothetical protein [Allosaccharopolyspora coralli]|uniref:hypothetical protein n=1 Tax=Allosaccharopolyspora coralli TaxID=2665642 RepID=UPI00389917D2